MSQEHKMVKRRGRICSGGQSNWLYNINGINRINETPRKRTAAVSDRIGVLVQEMEKIKTDLSMN